MDFYFHRQHKQNGTIITRVVCAVCFLAFSFIWLYEFQADLLAVAQHVLSGGVTHYDRTIGAVLITLVLLLLQLVVYAFTRLSQRTHALTYFPSMLVLAAISDVDADIDQHLSFGLWLWLFPLMLILWGGLVWLAKQMFPFGTDKKTRVGLFSKHMWMNLLQMALMMLGVALIGNTNAVFHFRAHAECALLRGDVEEALRVGQKSAETDETLTMLRVYALARQGQLGDRLFHYPIAGTSDNLLPSHAHLQILPADSVWKYLGARPAFPMSNDRYYYCVQHDSLSTAMVGDYVLCSHLIDRDLSAFVQALPRFYEVSDSLPLPRHYQEALVLYQHQCMHPLLIYHEPVVDEDWNNLKQLEAKYPDETERKLRVFEKYKDSYWYYYSYEKNR